MQIRHEVSLRPYQQRRPSTGSHTTATISQEGFVRDREKQHRRTFYAVSQHGENLLRAKSNWTPKSFRWSAHNVEVALCEEVHPRRKVIRK